MKIAKDHCIRLVVWQFDKQIVKSELLLDVVRRLKEYLKQNQVKHIQGRETQFKAINEE